MISSAAENTGIMPMLEDNGQLYLGTEGSGLFVKDEKNQRVEGYF